MRLNAMLRERAGVSMALSPRSSLAPGSPKNCRKRSLSVNPLSSRSGRLSGVLTNRIQETCCSGGIFGAELVRLTIKLVFSLWPTRRYRYRHTFYRIYTSWQLFDGVRVVWEHGSLWSRIICIAFVVSPSSPTNERWFDIPHSPCENMSLSWRTASFGRPRWLGNISTCSLQESSYQRQVRSIQTVSCQSWTRWRPRTW